MRCERKAKQLNHLFPSLSFPEGVTLLGANLNLKHLFLSGPAHLVTDPPSLFESVNFFFNDTTCLHCVDSVFFIDFQIYECRKTQMPNSIQANLAL